LLELFAALIPEVVFINSFENKSVIAFAARHFALHPQRFNHLFDEKKPPLSELVSPLLVEEPPQTARPPLSLSRPG
jgi:hypothetical protein